MGICVIILLDACVWASTVIPNGVSLGGNRGKKRIGLGIGDSDMGTFEDEKKRKTAAEKES